MTEFDFFDLVGLAYDPPETSVKQVKKKIEQKKAELGSELGREIQQTNRVAIQAQIDYLDSIIANILTSDGKKLLDSSFKSLADQKTAAELSSLTATVELLAMTGGHTVTEASIRHYKKESRLSMEHVKKVFSDAGFEIIDKDPMAAFPKFPTNADRIYSELAALRRTIDPNPNGADTSVVTDLYAFAAYISNDVENIAMYKAMRTKELWDIFDSASRKYSQRNDDLGKLCGSLSATAKFYVFNSDENRTAYERHLVYRSEELTKLFATMKKAPEATLLNAKFADPCIKIICNYFPEYEVALAIYNKEAGFTYDYYWPTAWVYTIRCNYCGYTNEFETDTDAKKENVCKNCNSPLFKKCDGCGNSVPSFNDSCPHCGWAFAGVKLFSDFYLRAKRAYRKKQYDAAREYLFFAQSAALGESMRIEQLSSLLDDVDKNKDEPMIKGNSSAFHPENPERVFGIHLGTTYSSISFINEKGEAEVICNYDEGSNFLASSVYFKKGADPIVGEAAKNQKDLEPERVVEFVKRYIGKPDAPKYEFDGVKYDPTTISALFLKRMKEYAEALGHDVKNVVITCPTYFDNEERAATKQAGFIAGLNVLNIINEPTAVALNYYAREFKENRKLIVYDLGGGTFDITLLDFSVDDDGKALIDIIKTGGDDRLGGIDWDARMFEYMCDEYAWENGELVDELAPELKAIIRSKAEQAKKDLSVLEKRRYTIKYDGDRTAIELNRQEFEKRTKNLVERTINLVQKLLLEVGFSANDIDAVLLAGGAAYMPMIKNAIESLFPGRVLVEQPNLAIVKGAALSTTIEWSERVIDIGEESGTDICKHPVLDIPQMSPNILGEPIKRSFGIGVIQNNKYLIDNVITLNMSLPAEGERIFGTSLGDQKDFRFDVFENASSELYVTPNIDENGNPQYTDPELKVKRIGEVRLKLPPNTPKGSPIRVVFRSSTVGLEVTAENMETGEVATVEIKPDNGYTADQVSEAKKRFEGINTSGQI